MKRSLKPLADRQTDSDWDRLYDCHQMSLVRFACASGCDEHAARDVVQDLFLRIYKRGMLLSLGAQSTDKQRLLLLRTLRWMISNSRRNQAAFRRSGGQVIESLDLLLEAGQEMPSYHTPASEYDRAWASGVLERGLKKLRSLLSTAAWKSLESSLLDPNGTYSPQPSNSKTRVAAYRARMRLRELLVKEAGVGSNAEASKSLLLQAAAHECWCLPN
jgi:DNA-directed RNA polymerase specialized sigma24 family protein